jgi:hypothetical protein
MSGSQNKQNDIVLSIYQDIRTVFRLNDIALLVGETSFQALNQKLNYHVRTGKLMNPRKGIYATPGYNPEELACTIYTPSYISLEYVLQKAGVVFQYDSRISAVGYLSRTIEVDGKTIVYRKVKGEILVNTLGITRHKNQINEAIPERAFLDLLYLNSEHYFDNLHPLNKDVINKLLPVYQSKTLAKKIKKLFTND